MLIIFFLYLLGVKYGEFDVNNALRSSDTLSNYIYERAEQCRSELNAILKEPLENGALCLSPDMWSDDHRKIHYLGITATFVNVYFEFKVVDLCCRPFTGDNQSGSNLLIVSNALFGTHACFSRYICMNNILSSFLGHKESIRTIWYLRLEETEVYV